MDTMSAFAMGEAYRDSPTWRVLDWDKAVAIINERGLSNVDAGLAGDLNWTQGGILSNGQPVEDRGFAYIGSTWATPVLVVDGEVIECWKSVPSGEDFEWWPESARNSLRNTDQHSSPLSGH